MLAGVPADLGVAAVAFVGTNIDNAVVTMAMVASAPAERARRIVAGQLIGFAILVGAAAATAVALFEFSARTIGLLGLVPLALGLRGLWLLRHRENRARTARRAVGSGVLAAMVVTIGAGGDNLAVYIPLFRVAGATNIVAVVLVFVVGEVLLTMAVLRSGGHPRTRAAVTHFGVVATPLLYCAIGVLVLLRAGTLSLLR
jgi:cadmium resistance protein CadD (predicted permease)